MTAAACESAAETDEPGRRGKKRKRKKSSRPVVLREESQQGPRVGEGIECNQRATAGVEEIAGYYN